MTPRRRAAAPGRLSAAARDHNEFVLRGLLAAAVGITMTLVAADAQSAILHKNDFYREATPAYSALIHGHLLAFAQHLPAYGGSLLLRAPFAIVPSLWGGSLRAIYVASAIPCMLAAAAFGVWLAGHWREGEGRRLVPTATVLLCIASPVVGVALYGGHPEEVLGAVLCVVSVAAAADGRGGWAGVLVGLAVANKPWALVVVPVVIAVLPAQRARALLMATASAGAVLLPIMLARQHGLSAAANGSATGDIFNPPQLLWWLGHRSWLAHEARPLIVLSSALVSAGWWSSRRRAPRSRSRRDVDALTLLALVLLIRAAFDPWNNLYYHIPFLFTLLALEIRARRRPLFTFAYTIALLVIVPISDFPISGDLRAALYAALILPTLAALALRLRPESNLAIPSHLARRQASLRARTSSAST